MRGSIFESLKIFVTFDSKNFAKASGILEGGMGVDSSVRFVGIVSGFKSLATFTAFQRDFESPGLRDFLISFFFCVRK